LNYKKLRKDLIVRLERSDQFSSVEGCSVRFRKTFKLLPFTNVNE